MIITNLPIVFLVWIVEVYLFLVLVRVVLSHIPTANHTQYYQQLKQFADSIPNYVKAWCEKQGKYPVWLPWSFVILVALTLREILIGLL